MSLNIKAGCNDGGVLQPHHLSDSFHLCKTARNRDADWVSFLEPCSHVHCVYGKESFVTRPGPKVCARLFKGGAEGGENGMF